MHSRTLLLPLGLSAVLAGCAAPATNTSTTQGLVPLLKTPPAPVEAQPSWPPYEPPPVVATQPAVTPQQPKPATPPFVPGHVSEREGRLLLDRLLPQGIADRKGWHSDIFNAFTHLKIPYSPQYFCATIAVAEQESSLQSDPVIPGLSKIVWGEIEKKRQKYLIPELVLNTALLKNSSDGRSYKERINALRTKRQMNALYEEMVSAVPFGQTMFKNPIRDGGPMQVSVAFAESHVRAWPYPYPYKSLRDEVFGRRGGVYFGTAILLQYPAPYSDMLYRFADFNAGRYSSRNAAFQAALSKLVKRKLSLDGDLLPYANKAEWSISKHSSQGSETQKALFSVAGQLEMSQDEILRDLKHEKLNGFGQSVLYKKVFALADQRAGTRLPREVLPQIRLISPKITRQLTTAWFANRVNGRYQNCLARGGV